jgi:hypothetical protein
MTIRGDQWRGSCHGSRQLPFGSTVVIQVDVNGDGHASPLDALWIINLLQRGETSFDEATLTWTFDPSIGTISTDTGYQFYGNSGLGSFRFLALGIVDDQYAFEFVHELEGATSKYRCRISTDAPVQSIRQVSGLFDTTFALNSCDLIESRSLLFA